MLFLATRLRLLTIISRRKLFVTIITSTLVLSSMTLLFGSKVHFEHQEQRPKATQFISKWSQNQNKPNSHRIYFHGARGKTALAAIRQSCAVESAARHNPDRPIELYISSNDPDGLGLPLSYSTDPWLAILEQYGNVAVIVYNESDYFSGSILQDWYQEGLWRDSPYGLVHLTDYWRVLSSYRGGGFYMDLDVITLKPLDEKFLWNFFSLEDKENSSFCSGVFHLEFGHRLIQSIIIQLAAKEYDPNVYSAYGPFFVKEFLSDLCGLRLPDLSSNHCQDLKILPSQYFFPVPWPEWETYFKEEGADPTLTRNSYGVHVWNKFSRNHTLKRNSREVYSTLASKNCPLTFASVTSNMPS